MKTLKITDHQGANFEVTSSIDSETNKTFLNLSIDDNGEATVVNIESVEDIGVIEEWLRSIRYIMEKEAKDA